MSLNEFFSMGGYAWYVWTAYGITLFVFGLNIWNAYSEKSRVHKMIKSGKNLPNKKVEAVLNIQLNRS